jgi:murein tripeptide amidase MpaA
MLIVFALALHFSLAQEIDPEMDNGSMKGFFSTDEVDSILLDLSLTYPDKILGTFSLGVSFQGREITAIQIADVNGPPLQYRPGFFINGAHHARELISVSQILYFIKRILEFPTPETEYLLKTRILWAVPIVNVDGYAYIA